MQMSLNFYLCKFLINKRLVLQISLQISADLVLITNKVKIGLLFFYLLSLQFKIGRLVLKLRWGLLQFNIFLMS